MTDMLNSVYQKELSDLGSAESRRRRARPVTLGARINLLPTVRNQIIPRLHEALQDSLSQPRLPALGPAGGCSLASEVPALSDELLAGDEARARDRIDRLRATGHSLETIYLEVLATTGCHLRDLWRDDLCGLADVTLALCALRSVLLHYAAEFHAEGSARGLGLRRCSSRRRASPRTSGCRRSASF